MVAYDYGSSMNGAQISYSGCFLIAGGCDNGDNTNLIGTQADSQTFTCSGSPCYTFYIPNYGQALTPVDISTDVYVFGGLNAFTTDSCAPVIGCWGIGTASVNLAILIDLKNNDNGQLSTMQVINDALLCNTNGSTCAQSKTYSQDYSQSSTFLLLPGHYTAYLVLTIQASSSANIGGSGNAYSCFYVSTNCPTGPETSTCPSGAQTLNTYCQFVEWKYTSYTIHYPNFEVSMNPSSLSMNAGSSTSTTITVTSSKVQNNNAYELSAQISLSATSDDPNLQLTVNPSPLTPPSGGTASATLTLSDPNTCDSGSHTVTVTATLNDPSGVAAQQVEQPTLPVSISRTCDFTIAAGTPTLTTPSPGSSLTAGVTIQSVNSLSSTIALSAQVSPNVQNGPTVTFNPTSVPLTAGQPAASTVTIQTTSSTPSSTYTVTIKGSDQSYAISHTASLSFIVSYPLSIAYVEGQPNAGLFPVTFTATVSGGTSPYTFSWQFGDSFTGTANPITHSYSRPGNYTAFLTATDAKGKTSQTTQTVVVTIPPIMADFGFQPNEATVGQTVTFYTPVTGAVPPYVISWNFGDGTTGTGATTSHAYQSASSYDVTLTIVDSIGEKFTYTHPFYVVRCFVTGDVNGDSKVNIFDLTTVGGASGSTVGSAGWNPSADINGDGKINIFDLTLVGANFGASC